MKEIKLTQGKTALVDDDMFEYLNQWKWYANNQHGCIYAISYMKKNNKKNSISMHRVILNTPGNMHTDHIDHNGLNNQRYNLRICTRRQNLFNRKGWGKSSKYIGVYVTGKQIRSLIRKNGQLIHLGIFKSEIEAAKAYDDAAKKNFGEFANLNFK